MPVIVNQEKCIGCGICIKSCPEPNVINRVGAKTAIAGNPGNPGDSGGSGKDAKKVSINTVFCKMCLLCASVCPKNAIHSTEE